MPVSHANDELRRWLHDEARLHEEVLDRLMPQLHLASAYVVADLVDFEGLASFDSCFGELSACKVRKALLRRAAASAAAPASARTPQSPCTALATPVAPAAVGLVRSRQLPDSITPRALFGDDEACGGEVRQVAAAEAAAVEAEAATALQACARGRRARHELEVRRAEEGEVRTPSLRHARESRRALRLTHVASAVGAAAMRIVEYDGDAGGPYGEQGVRQDELFKALSGTGAARGVTTTGQRAGNILPPRPLGTLGVQSELGPGAGGGGATAEARAASEVATTGQRAGNILPSRPLGTRGARSSEPGAGGDEASGGDVGQRRAKNSKRKARRGARGRVGSGVFTEAPPEAPPEVPAEIAAAWMQMGTGLQVARLCGGAVRYNRRMFDLDIHSSVDIWERLVDRGRPQWDGWRIAAAAARQRAWSAAVAGVEGGGHDIPGMNQMSTEEWIEALAKRQQVHEAAYAEPTEAMLQAVRRAVLEAKVKWARAAEARVAKAREASAAEEARAGRGAGSGARGGASLDWLVELEREEDWAREDKYDAAAFGVFMGSTGFSRFQGGLREWDEWDDELGMGFDEGD